MRLDGGVVRVCACRIYMNMNHDYGQDLTRTCTVFT